MIPIAQAMPGINLWNSEPGSTAIWIKMLVGLIIGLLLVGGLIALPSNMRRSAVALFTFVAGLFYVLYWIWPEPIAREDGTQPRNMVEGVGFFLADALPHVANFSNILAAFLLGLGVYSLMRIHLRKLVKQQRDWGFSVVLLTCMVLMVLFGYGNWYMRHFGADSAVLDDPRQWHFTNYVSDLLFDGLLQQMDAAMFSVIAFYILSAAYRAFRIRSIEATILLATALIVMLSLMGGVVYIWDTGILGFNKAPEGFTGNFTLTEISGWVRNTVQTPAIRGIDFGVGIGALAMGLRLWLSLERQGQSA